MSLEVVVVVVVM